MSKDTGHKDPAFLFYPADFVMGTVYMTDEEVGKYIRLMCMQHQYGGRIKSDYFKKICENFPEVQQKFKEDANGFYNERLQFEIEKRHKFYERQRANGKKRWENYKKEESPEIPEKGNNMPRDSHGTNHGSATVKPQLSQPSAAAKPGENENENINININTIRENEKKEKRGFAPGKDDFKDEEQWNNLQTMRAQRDSVNSKEEK
ncbi:MAG: hypothetical protein VB031_02375 [Eubacteriaceae bacterium]|nr:hypothetical protein [Eubacteriaceae bacterium]